MNVDRTSDIMILYLYMYIAILLCIKNETTKQGQNGYCVNTYEGENYICFQARFVQATRLVILWLPEHVIKYKNRLHGNSFLFENSRNDVFQPFT